MIELYNCDYKTMLDKLIDKKIVIITDPPFNVKYHYKTYKDNLNEQQYYKELSDLFLNLDCPFIVVHYPESLHKISFYTQIMPERVVSWVYNSNTAKQHRDIGFYKIKPNFNLVKQPYKNLNDRRIKERIAKGCAGAKLYDWWNINQVKNVSKRENSHPCVMPLQVMENIIGVLPSDYIVFDPFMGSGTTGVACKHLDRDFIGCDIDKEYYEIAKRRIGDE